MKSFNPNPGLLTNNQAAKEWIETNSASAEILLLKSFKSIFMFLVGHNMIGPMKVLWGERGVAYGRGYVAQP